ncbi:GAF domain-containing hybrid sensor histidine kinase/response regulator [Phenylobacterium montanum]|uniref:histidine kinase n=1 Tax=Phenylobacterium montanum TaxID=2823693 RepID=A0A975IX81_9CAUL|nr:GAF domain-containing hybrid sensor histidine kinase/response regulator [Caulobacter sp. S6]QUD89131.1 PAS domain-containing protein [Caulobacter sp. S6]
MNDLRELSRLQTLKAYGVLDTQPDEAFDRLTSLAASLFEAPIALVSLVDAERQWFKSHHGLDVEATPRSWSFCAHALALPRGGTLVVEDATLDQRFCDNPLVCGDPHIRFYAGAVLTAPNGDNLGALCVIDSQPRPSPSVQDLNRLQLLAGIAIDELEFMRAKRLADEQERLLKMAERISGVGSWRREQATGLAYWSDEVFRIHGLGRDEFDPHWDRIIDLYHEDDRALLEAMVEEARRTGRGYEHELRIRRPDGEIRDVMFKAECQTDNEGRVTDFFGVLQDVTERKQILRELARARDEAEEQAQRALRAEKVAGLGHWRFDAQTQELYWSPEMYRIYGLDPTEPLERDRLVAMTHPEDVESTGTMVQRALDGDVSDEQTVTRIFRGDGELRFVAGRWQVERGPDGEILAAVGTALDVTEQKRAEAELLEARAEAEAAAAVKSVFLANMSHELRTPLTSIVGFTRLALEQDGLTGLARDYVERVADASRALLSSVNDILDFSKLEAGQVNLHPQPTSLSHLVKTTLDLFIPQAAAKDLKLDFVAGPGVEHLVLLVDPDRVRQILLNLVGNAVKFTEHGGVTLSAAYDEARGELSVDVVDTGVGVPAEKQTDLFQRFSQVDGSLTRSHTGTGLGLAICKGLVEAMGGAIGVESAAGRGSRFWFRIAAPLDTSRLKLAGGDGAVDAGGALSGLKLLVADDHAANRELARLVLLGLGAEVAEAQDGEEAVERATGAPFDVILMDLRMPRLDGLAAMQRIRRSDGPNRTAPILAFTADVDANVAARLKEAGFDALVAKPLNLHALIETVIGAVRAERSPTG